MSDKLKLSTEATNKLNNLSSGLNLRKNIICRIAIGCSLGMKEPIEKCDEDYAGLEFNKTTIIGADEFAIVAMMANQSNHLINMDNYFNVEIRAHIIRGLNRMDEMYSCINSPVEFMKKLCGLNDENEINQIL